ncbi:dihydropteroate synthase [Galbitalea soli]|uniref:Dihydropteroate synthase n=2 Tax=Galbitalea soli TaxID=1268042 RepID=A0A7C9PPJ3_9MICO|nr:dihydropteroate synthase [Galbitalea soli]NEM92385.1 dihydropteroate synthase [Galbitalea soli]
MAIVNRTPDSFFDKGATFALDRAVDAAARAAEQGADWVDVGGVPFGKGPVVTLDEELDRIVPLVEAIHARSDVVISVDTISAEVARQSILAGASVVNDTSGMFDPNMAGVVAASSAQLVLTHSKGAPRSEMPRPLYDDVVAEVIEYLRARIEIATAAGIPRERLIIDPGHDLNKNTVHTLEITRRLQEVADLGLPLLAAVSNKDFIGETLDRPQGQRLTGSIAAAVICIMNGARIIRMHDVPTAVEAARMAEAVLGWREPVHAIHNNG